MDLNEEIRCDFLVTQKRKGIWNVQLEMLGVLLSVCKKYDIKIFAVAGTMLGAVRHKGYIPWDDDIDMAMCRKDFEKLIEIGSSEFSYPYFLQTAINDTDYYSPLIRLRDSRTTAIIRNGSHDDWGRNCNNGIYIDIFPLDGLTENSFKRKLQFFQVRFLNMIMRERVYIEKGRFMSSFRHTLIKSLISEKNLKRIYKKYNRVCSRYSYLTEKVALIQGSVFNKAYYWYYEDISDTVLTEFENIMIPIPKGFQRCLSIQYGDYMKLPPIDKRGAHHLESVIFDPFIDYKSYYTNHS
jgi:lipopolysaccharide cholinephosphotransferase